MFSETLTEIPLVMAWYGSDLDEAREEIGDARHCKESDSIEKYRDGRVQWQKTEFGGTKLNRQ